MRTKFSLTLDEAQVIAAGCLAAARRDGRNVCIAITDDAGALIVLTRMDGAKSFSPDLATRKARLAAIVGAPTAVIEGMQKDRPTSPDMVVAQGGWPVIHEGLCTGGVGVSGAKPEEDEAIARAGIAALSAASPP